MKIKFVGMEITNENASMVTVEGDHMLLTTAETEITVIEIEIETEGALIKEGIILKKM